MPASGGPVRMLVREDNVGDLALARGRLYYVAGRTVKMRFKAKSGVLLCCLRWLAELNRRKPKRARKSRGDDCSS